MAATTTTTMFSRATCCVLLMTVTLAALLQVASARPRLCALGHAHHASAKSLDCVYGWELDSCGHKTCTKGPGEQCGGKHAIYGICGEGLVCSNCNRCTGCSLRTYKCFEDPQCLV